VEFAYNNSYQASLGVAPYEALYGRKCRSPICWLEVGEERLDGPTLVSDATEKIRIIQERLEAAQSRQKSYADTKRRPLKFEIGDFVFLKASPIKGVKRFGKSGKLQPRYIGPFEVLEKVGEVSYRLALSPELSYVHDVFHVSMLRRYLPNSDEKLLVTTPIELRGDLSYEVKPEKIIGRKDKVLRNKVIPLVKVWWMNNWGGEATWETEEDMRKKFPYLFPIQGK
jgi:hypothetical protein